VLLLVDDGAECREKTKLAFASGYEPIEEVDRHAALSPFKVMSNVVLVALELPLGTEGPSEGLTFFAELNRLSSGVYKYLSSM